MERDPRLLDVLLHHLRMPLFSLERDAERILKRGGLSQETRNDLLHMQHTCAFATNMIETETILALPPSTPPRCHPRQSDTHALAQMVKKATELFEGTDSYRGVNIQLDLADFMMGTPISYDRRLTSLAITHLLENALQFGSGSHPVAVEAKVTNKNASIIFANRHVTFRGQQTDSFLQNRRLEATRRIAEAHGGVLVASSPDRTGSMRLVFSLPIMGSAQ